ncbi:MAG TPA: hypothetical protein PLA85_07355 [Micropepsaceae bacterium]|nr:hypothetical protein [Micropepsaceae bacterium]HRK71388.1 hypothetical protein [Micropepsaceae bacterium]
MKWVLALALVFTALTLSPQAHARAGSEVAGTEDAVDVQPGHAAPVVVARRGDRDEAGDVMPLDQVLANLRARYSGDMLEVKGGGRDGDGRPYRIKWLTDEGAVLYITVDARTGEILSVQGDD